MSHSERLVELIAVHTVQVALVALAVGLFVRLTARNRPYLAHAMWALVILKCLTPPIIPSPTSLCGWLIPAQRPSLQNTGEHPIAAAGNSAAFHVTYLLGEPRQAIPHRANAHEPLDDRESQDDREPRLDANFANLDSGFPWATWLITIWATGGLVILATSVVRLACFLRWLGQKSSCEPQGLREFAGRFAKQIGLSRRVNIRVVDALFGPAVIGLFRPTIILPRWLVEETEEAHVQLLIAHEIMHARTGDLRWSLLQTLATSVCWFHPLAWWASRRLAQEAERRCDQATVSALACKPAEYARALLQVLERKHQLRVAPALPGARPVDITSQRLERIMRLGQGSQYHRSRWNAWAFFGVACLVLPGARFGLAQQQGEPLPPAPAAKVASRDPVEMVTQPVVERQYDVTEIVELMVRDALIEEQDQAGPALTSLLPIFEPRLRDVMHFSFASRVAQNTQYADNMLTVTASEADQSAVESALQRMKADGFRQICVSVKLVSTDFAKLEKLFWEPAPRESEALPIGHIDALALKPERTFQSRMTEAETQAFIKLLESDARTNILFAPRVTLFGGTSAEISDVVQRPFVTDVKTHEVDGTTIDQPVIEVLREGITIAVKPKLDGNNQIQLQVSVLTEDIEQVRTFTYHNRESNGKTIQIPDVARALLSTDVSLAPGETIALTGGVPADPQGDQAARIFLISPVTLTGLAEQASQQKAAKPAPSLYRDAEEVKEAGANPAQLEPLILTINGSQQPATDTKPLQDLFKKLGSDLKIYGDVQYMLKGESVELQADNWVFEAPDAEQRLSGREGRLVMNSTAEEFTLTVVDFTGQGDGQVLKADECEMTNKAATLRGDVVINLEDRTTILGDRVEIRWGNEIEVFGNAVVVVQDADAGLKVSRGDHLRYDHIKKEVVEVQAANAAEPPSKQ